MSYDSNEFIQQDEKGSLGNSIRRTKLVTLTRSETESADTDNEIVPLPVPYELPPPLYSSQAQCLSHSSSFGS